MHFQGPLPEDLDNVYSLNRAFLDLERRDAIRLPDKLATHFDRLDDLERRRLARSPFLLFSIAETEPDRWERLFEGGFERDLVDRVALPAAELAELASAATGFLWQLAGRNPYAVRVMSGASLDWCERLAARPLVEAVRFVCSESELIAPRLAEHALFWHRLLVAGTSTQKDVRRAARLSALQALLATRSDERYRRIPAAACSLPATGLRVAEREMR
jgi:hypothetical protein